MVSIRDLNEGMGDSGSIALVCPVCRGELSLENPYRRLGRVRTGELRCLADCGAFPIIYGVPIMLRPGQPASWRLPPWKSFLREHGKQRLMEAIAAGEFDKKIEEDGPPVASKKVDKVRRTMTKAGWQKCLTRDKASSDAPDAVAIAERLSNIESGVIVDFGCGGGFTAERAIQEIQESVCCIPIDIDFECAKRAGKRAEVLGKGDSCLEMCADLKSLPFEDDTIAAIYTRNGFNHIHRYFDALKEAYRTLESAGHLIATDGKYSMWRARPDFIGISYEGQRDIMQSLGLYAGGDEFIEDVRQVGFSILSIEDLPMPKRFKFILEAIKN